jgi:Na+/melibiose symporter-like transporter
MQITGLNSPETSVEPPELTTAAFAYIKSTGTWMFFIGILCFISSGLMLIASITIIYDAVNLGRTDIISLLIDLVYIPMAVLCFFPAKFLVTAGSSIRVLKKSASPEVLESTLRSSAAYWKFSGILCIVCLALIVPVIVIASMNNFN